MPTDQPPGEVTSLVTIGPAVPPDSGSGLPSVSPSSSSSLTSPPTAAAAPGQISTFSACEGIASPPAPATMAPVVDGMPAEDRRRGRGGRRGHRARSRERGMADNGDFSDHKRSRSRPHSRTSAQPRSQSHSRQKSRQGSRSRPRSRAHESPAAADHADNGAVSPSPTSSLSPPTTAPSAAASPAADSAAAAARARAREEAKWDYPTGIVVPRSLARALRRGRTSTSRSTAAASGKDDDDGDGDEDEQEEGVARRGRRGRSKSREKRRSRSKSKSKVVSGVATTSSDPHLAASATSPASAAAATVAPASMATSPNYHEAQRRRGRAPSVSFAWSDASSADPYGGVAYAGSFGYPAAYGGYPYGGAPYGSQAAPAGYGADGGVTLAPPAAAVAGEGEGPVTNARRERARAALAAAEAEDFTPAAGGKTVSGGIGESDWDSRLDRSYLDEDAEYFDGRCGMVRGSIAMCMIHPAFHLVYLTAFLMQIALAGFSIHHAITDPHKHIPQWYKILDIVVLSTFIVEISLTLTVLGARYFHSWLHRIDFFFALVVIVIFIIEETMHAALSEFITLTLILRFSGRIIHMVFEYCRWHKRAKMRHITGDLVVDMDAYDVEHRAAFTAAAAAGGAVDVSASGRSSGARYCDDEESWSDDRSYSGSFEVEAGGGDSGSDSHYNALDEMERGLAATGATSGGTLAAGHSHACDVNKDPAASPGVEALSLDVLPHDDSKGPPSWAPPANPRLSTMGEEVGVELAPLGARSASEVVAPDSDGPPGPPAHAHAHAPEHAPARAPSVSTDTEAGSQADAAAAEKAGRAVAAAAGAGDAVGAAAAAAKAAVAEGAGAAAVTAAAADAAAAATAVAAAAAVPSGGVNPELEPLPKVDSTAAEELRGEDSFFLASPISATAAARSPLSGAQSTDAFAIHLSSATPKPEDDFPRGDINEEDDAVAYARALQRARAARGPAYAHLAAQRPLPGAAGAGGLAPSVHHRPGGRDKASHHGRSGDRDRGTSPACAGANPVRSSAALLPPPTPAEAAAAALHRSQSIARMNSGSARARAMSKSPGLSPGPSPSPAPAGRSPSPARGTKPAWPPTTAGVKRGPSPGVLAGATITPGSADSTPSPAPALAPALSASSDNAALPLVARRGSRGASPLPPASAAAAASSGGARSGGQGGTPPLPRSGSMSAAGARIRGGSDAVRPWGTLAEGRMQGHKVSRTAHPMLLALESPAEAAMSRHHHLTQAPYAAHGHAHSHGYQQPRPAWIRGSTVAPTPSVAGGPCSGPGVGAGTGGLTSNSVAERHATPVIEAVPQEPASLRDNIPSPAVPSSISPVAGESSSAAGPEDSRPRRASTSSVRRRRAELAGLLAAGEAARAQEAVERAVATRGEKLVNMALFGRENLDDPADEGDDPDAPWSGNSFRIGPGLA